MRGICATNDVCGLNNGLYSLTPPTELLFSSRMTCAVASDDKLALADSLFLSGEACSSFT